MKTKRILSLLLAVLIIAGTILSAVVIPVFAEETATEGTNSPADGTVAHPYVTDGLVSLYSGTQNSRDGHDLEAAVWQDLVGQHDLTINKNDKNYFTASGLAAEGTRHLFPQGIVDVVNGQEFTVELFFSEFVSLGTTFNTFLNSSNDNFALFRRNGPDQIEFKFNGNTGEHRHKIDNGLELLQNALITVTYKVGGTCYIYINGKLMAEKPSPNTMGADNLYIGHDDGSKTFNTTFRSMRFYSRALTESEIVQNALADGAMTIADRYVGDGLVSLYSDMATGSTAGVWEDLVGENDVTVVIDENNRFVDGGYVHKGAKNFFPQPIVDLINGDAFTVELHVSDLAQGAAAYCTILSSDNDHFALFRRNSSDELEFKFAANAASSRNKVPGCLETLQNALITITYKVGGESRIYINGVLQSTMSAPSAMGADNFFFGHSQEDRFFDAVFHDIRFYSRELNADEVKANARADGYNVPESDIPVVHNPGFVTVAQPKTHIVGDISFIREINTASELEVFLAAEQKPAIALYTVSAELAVMSDKGASISTVGDVLAATEYQVLSAFRPKNAEAAEALAAYLKDIRFYDCLIVSSDPAVIKSFRSTLPTVSGVIDYTEAYKSAEALTEEQCLTIRRSMKENNGTIALLPTAVCSHETVQYLYARQVNVWVKAADTPSVTAQYDALLSGAIGVVSDATDSLLDIACNQLPANTMTRITLNVGHRGIPSKAPENTLEGSILAFEQGANVIELDVYLTTDGHVVVMHDGNTGRTCDKDVMQENCTLAELKTIHVNKGYEESETFKNCLIPTLDEYLAYFKGKDCNLYIEIKSSKTEIVKACKKLVDEYDMYGQCTVITFNEPIMAAMRQDWPEMHVGALCGGFMAGANPEADFRAAMEFIGKYNASLNPSSGGFDSLDIRVALMRGISIYPWTFRGGLAAYSNYFIWGYSGLTGDNADVLGRLARDVSYTGETTFKVGDTLNLTLSVKNYRREVEEKIAAVTILSGEQYVKLTDSTLEFAGSGEVTILLSYSERVTRNDNQNLYTQPITITIEAEETNLPETLPPETLPPETTPGTDSPDPSPDTDTPITDTSETITETDAGKKDDGCGSIMSLASILSIIIGAALTLYRRKDT